MTKVSVAIGDVWWVRIKNKVQKLEVGKLSPKGKIIHLGETLINPFDPRLPRWSGEDYDVREVEFLECVHINELPKTHALIERHPQPIP